MQPPLVPAVFILVLGVSRWLLLLFPFFHHHIKHNHIYHRQNCHRQRQHLRSLVLLSLVLLPTVAALPAATTLAAAAAPATHTTVLATPLKTGCAFQSSETGIVRSAQPETLKADTPTIPLSEPKPKPVDAWSADSDSPAIAVVNSDALPPSSPAESPLSSSRLVPPTPTTLLILPRSGQVLALQQQQRPSPTRVPPAYTPIVTPPPDQDAALARMGYRMTTFYACNTIGGNEHCGWHVPVLKADGPTTRTDPRFVIAVVSCLAGLFAWGML